jgi:hypothetical protein
MFMAISFTIRFWEISDFSNRPEMKEWLGQYVADGWWRRGGAHIMLSMVRMLAVTGFVLLVIQAVATQVAVSIIPDSRIVVSVVAVGLSVTFLIWQLGYYGVRVTEQAFVRYVSQNVSYTSSIVLKRALKSKIDLGLLLVICIYMPLLYTLVKGLIGKDLFQDCVDISHFWQLCLIIEICFIIFLTVMTDWNNTTVADFRKNVNYFVSSYFLAFPPYRNAVRDPDTCPFMQYSSEFQSLRQGGK